jgi:trans-2,3-dihydro-3-hydroxyanthranilate isomerase
MSGPFSYRLLNVFTEGDVPFTGNPLCVFEDGSDLTPAQMQSLALQFNLSETTFVTSTHMLDDELQADAAVRIFTPAFELPFAGHPTLGTAHVVRDLLRAGDSIVLRVPAGDIPVEATGDTWTLQAQPPRHRLVEAARDDLAALVSLPADAIIEEPLWVNTGVEQLVIPLRSAADVRAAIPDTARTRGFGPPEGETMLYLWAPAGGNQTVADEIEARMFAVFRQTVIEDPATGSACANLGGWFVVNGDTGPSRTIHQGSAVGRPSLLHLTVEETGRIKVSGDVRELGRGTVSWPSD